MKKIKPKSSDINEKDHAKELRCRMKKTELKNPDIAEEDYAQKFRY